MPVSSSIRVCTHIKVTGVRCGSPALRGEQFCYFHQRMHRGVRTPPQARLHPVALIEDEESIQSALMEVINALMRNTIDLKRAALILRALHIAVKNASRVKISLHAKDMVREIPDYAEPCEGEPTHVATGTPASLPRAESRGPGGPEVPGRSPFAQQSELDIPAAIVPPESRPPIIRPTHAEIERRRAEFLAAYNAPQAPAAVYPDGTAHVGSTTADVVTPTTHVGTATPASLPRAGSRGPGGPEVPGRSAVAPAHDSAMKKKPQGEKHPAPKERNITAHAARRG